MASDKAMELGDGQLSFRVENLSSPDGDAVVYVSRDPQWGKLSLAIRNTSSDKVIHADTGSLLTLRLDSLLSAAEIGAIPQQPEASDWEGGPVSKDSTVLLELHPKRRIPIRPLDSITIEIDNVLASGAMTTGYFVFAWSGLQPVDNGSQRVTVFRHKPPVPGQSPWPLTVSFAPRQDYGNFGDTVYVTPWTVTPEKPAIANAFVLQLTNQGSALPMSDDAKPSLVISFVTGDGDNALCLDQQLKDVDATVTQADPNAPWNTPEKDTLGPAAIWTVTPDPDNPYLFDAGEILRLRFENLKTQSKPDFGSPVFIQCGGLPHYNDCLLPVATLNKADPIPQVLSLEGEFEGKNLPFGGEIEDYGPATLRWKVFAAEACYVTSSSVSLGPFKPIDGTPVDPPVEPRQAITYSLVPQWGGRPRGSAAPFTFSVAPLSAPLSARVGVTTRGGRGRGRNPPPSSPIHPWSVEVRWNTTGAASCTVSHPILGILSTDRRGTWRKFGQFDTRSPGMPPPAEWPYAIQAQPFRIEAKNPVDQVSHDVQARLDE